MNIKYFYAEGMFTILTKVAGMGHIWSSYGADKKLWDELLVHIWVLHGFDVNITPISLHSHISSNIFCRLV